MANPTTYSQVTALTGGTSGTFGTPVTSNLTSNARHLLAIVYSACDTVFTAAEGTAGDQLQFVSASLGVADQRFLVGPWNSSGPATNSSGQAMVQDIIPLEELLPVQGNEAYTFALATSGDTITTGHAALAALMFCQDLPPDHWRKQFPLPYSARGGYQVEAEQLTTTQTALTAISVPSWATETVAVRANVEKADAITAAQYEQGYFALTSSIPNIAPAQIPTNSDGSTLGTPVGTGMYHDSLPFIPYYIALPGGTQTITPNINLTAAVSTGNDVAFGITWR